MDGFSSAHPRTRRRAVGTAAAVAMLLTVAACGGAEQSSAPTTKSRAEMQRDAAVKDGSIEDTAKDGSPNGSDGGSDGGSSSGAGSARRSVGGSGLSAAESIDAMRVAAVGKTRTDPAAIAGPAAAAGSGSTAGGSSSGSSAPAPKPTPSNTTTPTQTTVVPWSGITTNVEVRVAGGTAEFTGKVCNTTSRQRTITQNRAAAGVVIRKFDGGRIEFPAPGPGSSTLTIGPTQCQTVPLAVAGWNGKESDGTTPAFGGPFTVSVSWDATELGTSFGEPFVSSPFTL